MVKCYESQIKKLQARGAAEDEDDSEEATMELRKALLLLDGVNEAIEILEKFYNKIEM